MPPGDVLRKYRLVLRFRAENRRLVSRWSGHAGDGAWRACGGPGLTGSPAPGRPASPCGDDHPHVRDTDVYSVIGEKIIEKIIAKRPEEVPPRAKDTTLCFAASTQSRTTQREAAFSGRACLAGWQCFVQRFVSRSEDSDSLRARRGRRGRRRPQSRHRPGRHRTPCRPWR